MRIFLSNRLAIALAAVTIGAAAPALAGQHHHQSSHHWLWQDQMCCSANYDMAKEQAFTGVVEEVLAETGGWGRMGHHLMLKTDTETLTVHVGPAWFLRDKGFSFAKGDRVEIVGAKMPHAGSPMALAREIKVSGRTLTLRNERGEPLWSPCHGCE